jgi:hypothetical protein
MLVRSSKKRVAAIVFLVAPISCVCIDWPEATTDKLDRYDSIGVISAAHLDRTPHRVR